MSFMQIIYKHIMPICNGIFS